MINSRENGESRKFGALGIISRELSGGTEVLLMDDVSKSEMPAGLRVYYPEGKKLKSFPGGGRGIYRNGDCAVNERSETLVETIKSEVSEELGLVLTSNQISNGITQIYPFVVAQRKDAVIDRVAVTSKLIQFESLNIEQKKHINSKVKLKKAEWICMRDLAFCYEFLLENNNLVSETQFRIIAYIVSYVFFKTISGWSDEAVQDEIGRMNRETNGALVNKYDEGFSRNSVFSSSGNILAPDQLSSDDAAFLYGITN